MIDLANISTSIPEGLKKKEVVLETKKITKRIGELQQVMYAEGKHSILVVLQGMDASGKDGTTNTVFKYCSPTGIDVHSFKKPTEEEMSHDFLWRVHKNAPSKGRLMIFNRSHYEDILIQRVHNWIDDKKANMRMEAINMFERLLQEDNNTTILKFYLHISPQVQTQELQQRIDIPEKNWKHNDNDWIEAKRWDEYRKCYEDAINHSEIPWHIAPADKGWYRNYCVAKVVLETLENMNLQLPKL